MIEDFLFDDWSTLLRTVIVCLCAYPGMLLILRISGHRTLSKLNAFDLIVTVALGSTLGAVITSREVSVAQGLLTFALLVAFQYLVAKLASLRSTAERLINGEPKFLFAEGKFLDRAMNESRITGEEIRASVRKQKIGDMSLVDAVVLETDGSISVIGKDLAGKGSALQGVRRL